MKLGEIKNHERELYYFQLRIGVAGVAVLTVLYLAARRLADNGQFEADKWAPLFDPSTEEFPLVWGLIGQAAVKTLTAATLAITVWQMSGQCV